MRSDDHFRRNVSVDGSWTVQAASYATRVVRETSQVTWGSKPSNSLFFFLDSRTLWQRSRAHHTAGLWLLVYFSKWIGTAQIHLPTHAFSTSVTTHSATSCNLYLLTRDRPAPQATFTEIAITRLEPDSDSSNALFATRPFHLSSLMTFYIRGSVTCSVHWSSMLSNCPQTNQS
ncbi:hypothetical protein B0H14DRAFT_2750559 [Mycena olivaceomarginata]|nr:hypothetical protein B0H14DRAFT_2750559 [Mycena olivaceomarginata]